MRKIKTQKESRKYEIEIDGEVKSFPVRDYYDCPDISFMVMREINFMNEKYRAIDPDYEGATLDFEQIISKAFIKSTQTKSDKKAQEIINSVTVDTKEHALKCIYYMLDDSSQNYNKLFENISYTDILAILRDIMFISQGKDEEDELTEPDKKKELSNTNDTTINSESPDILKEKLRNGVNTKDSVK